VIPLESRAATLSPATPDRRVAAGVKNRNDNQLIGIDPKEYRVRKSPHSRSAYVSQYRWELLRRFGCGRDSIVNGHDEGAA
jgi:hypothetical protein